MLTYAARERAAWGARPRIRRGGQEYHRNQDHHVQYTSCINTWDEKKKKKFIFYFLELKETAKLFHPRSKNTGNKWVTNKNSQSTLLSEESVSWRFLLLDCAYRFDEVTLSGGPFDREMPANRKWVPEMLIPFRQPSGSFNLFGHTPSHFRNVSGAQYHYECKMLFDVSFTYNLGFCYWLTQPFSHK